MYTFNKFNKSSDKMIYIYIIYKATHKAASQH